MSAMSFSGVVRAARATTSRLLTAGLLALSCHAAAALADAQPVWAVADQRALDARTLLAHLARADVILLGEQHDNPAHHRIQAQVIQALAQRGRRPAVVLEMLDRDQQAGLDRIRREHPHDVDAVAAGLNWAESGWPAWEHYRPVFAAAYAHGLPIIAGNLPRAEARELAKGGETALDHAQRRELFLDRTLPSSTQETLEQEIAAAHCGLLPPEALAPMVLAQRARDGALARAALDALAAHDGVVVITGNGHARRDRAVPWLLARAAPQLATVAVSLQGEPQASPDEPYDYVWHTPPGPDRDYCAELREQMRSRHR